MRCLILTYDKYQDHELIYPYYSAQEHGFDVTICANKTGKINGILGTHMPCHITFDELFFEAIGIIADLKNGELSVSGPTTHNVPHIGKYDLLIIPGGVKALEKLRLEYQAVKFVKEWFKADKPCMCICNGAQLLITADVLRGRKCSGYYSIEPDIKNAGAEYSRGVVVDRNLVSCAHYDDMGEWVKTAMNYFKMFYFPREVQPPAEPSELENLQEIVEKVRRERNDTTDPSKKNS